MRILAHLYPFIFSSSQLHISTSPNLPISTLCRSSRDSVRITTPINSSSNSSRSSKVRHLAARSALATLGAPVVSNLHDRLSPQHCPNHFLPSLLSLWYIQRWIRWYSRSGRWGFWLNLYRLRLRSRRYVCSSLALAAVAFVIPDTYHPPCHRAASPLLQPALVYSIHLTLFPNLSRSPFSL